MRTVVAGLNLPIGATFLGDGDMLVLEKNTGRVLRVTDGEVTATALDLAVNSASERCLLSIRAASPLSREPERLSLLDREHDW